MKISILPQDTAPSLTDQFAIVDTETGLTKRVSLQDLRSLITPPQLRRAEFMKTSDNSGGALITQQEAGEVTFSGTPTGYARLQISVPLDYVTGTTATIKVLLYSTNANNPALIYYIGSHYSGQAFTSWNVQNAQVTASGINLSTAVSSLFSLYTIPASLLQAGANITVAVRPNTAVNGNIYLTAAYLEYTASI